MKKKIQLSLILLSILITSCSSVREIGKVNMISTRNIDASVKYEILTTYSGGSKRELKKSSAKSVDDAIDKTVKRVAGGEYLMNVKIYKVHKHHYAVEGDVWGIPSHQSYRGFKVGDKVTWKNTSLLSHFKGNKYLTGIISAHRDDRYCLVKVDGKDKTIELSYDEISKINQ